MFWSMHSAGHFHYLKFDIYATFCAINVNSSCDFKIVLKRLANANYTISVCEIANALQIGVNALHYIVTGEIIILAENWQQKCL